jgi:hypothetical protein
MPDHLWSKYAVEHALLCRQQTQRARVQFVLDFTALVTIIYGLNGLL